METVNLFGAQRGRAAQAAAWAMEKERFSTQEMANALAVSTPTAITLLRRLEGHGLVPVSYTHLTLPTNSRV